MLVPALTERAVLTLAHEIKAENCESIKALSSSTPHFRYNLHKTVTAELDVLCTIESGHGVRILVLHGCKVCGVLQRMCNKSVTAALDRTYA